VQNRLLIWVATGVLVSSISHADEKLWVYTKGAETLPKGEVEAKLGFIRRTGKVDSRYQFNDIRAEVEYGVSNRLTVYGELIIFDHNYSTSNPDLQPYHDTQGGDGGRFNKTQVGGFELGGKYNLLSPYKDPVGLSVGLSWDHRRRYRLDGAAIRQNAVEISAYLQKNFINNQLVLALSPTIEYETRHSPGVLEKEIGLDVAAGISYRVAPNWYLGTEFRHQSDYLSPLDTETGEYDPNLKPSKFPFKFGSQYQNGNYLGPTVHYATQKWWVTAGLLWQIAGGGGFAFNRDGRNWDEHERQHFGLTFSREF
jgi:opacity protein-like surface antigen